MLTKGRIERAGSVRFHDASIYISEEGISEARAIGGYAGAKAWERQFKRDVFARIVQQLRRLGWTCTMPEIDPHSVKHYGGTVARWSAESKRFCTKGDLKADLRISGRCIEFNMFQSINCPTRPDHEGRYEHNKEAAMPYLLRLEMERTRRRISVYLCNVFTGYEFEPPKIERGTGATALEIIEQRYRESWHFKGDLTKHTISDHNNRGADGGVIEHGARVWYADYFGRMLEGTAYYNINNMWWIVTGKYDFTNEADFHIYTKKPENLRIKRNASIRRKRLEAELQKAIAAMDFERAAILRDITFPKGQPLFSVWHSGHNLYHCSGFNGYTSDLSKAGKFTAEEVKGWDHAPNRIIPLEGMKQAA